MKKIYLRWRNRMLTWVFISMPCFGFAQATHFQFGNSMRNNQLSHYYKMLSWDDSPYKESAYWMTSSGGSVVEFMNWRMVFPPGYQQTGGTKYPMIIMLHGAGESGRVWTGNYSYTPSDPEYDNNDLNLRWGGQEHLQAVNTSPSNSRAFPGIVVFPQVSYNGAWGNTWNNGVLSTNGRMAAGIVEYMIKNYNVDQYRVYIHGLSAGAKGVWDVATKRPDLFAAMLPMSGVGSDIDIQTDVVLTMPLWLFQGGQDTDPSEGWAQQWIDKLKSKGGNPRFTVYWNLGHNVWTTAYQEPDFFSWMRAQDKRNIYVFGGTTTLASNPSIKLGFSAGFLSYQWMVDGVDIAGATSRYFTATQPGAYQVRFTRQIDGVTDVSFPTQITQDQPPPPPPPPPTNGVSYNYYEYSGSLSGGLSSFDFSQVPKASGSINNFNLNPRARNDHYVLSFDGYLQIDNAGTYRFYTNSDDGSRLYINNTLIVNNDGWHAPTVRSGTYTFSTTGKYAIRVTYFQETGGQTLVVRYNRGTGNNYSSASAIPDNKLFLDNSNSSGRLASTALANEADSTAVNTGVQSSEIKAFPNPFKGILYISVPDVRAQPAVKLYDLTSSNLVRSLQVQPQENLLTLDLYDLPNGYYVLAVDEKKFRVVKTD